jgi:hypothetical protein
VSYYPEPWSPADDADLEIAQEMVPLAAADPATSPGKSNGSVFRRYWEKLLGR